MDAAGVLKEYIAIYAKVFSNITNTANSKNIADCWHSFLLASSRNVEDVFRKSFKRNLRRILSLPFVNAGYLLFDTSSNP